MRHEHLLSKQLLQQITIYILCVYIYICIYVSITCTNCLYRSTTFTNHFYLLVHNTYKIFFFTTLICLHILSVSLLCLLCEDGQTNTQPCLSCVPSASVNKKFICVRQNMDSVLKIWKQYSQNVRLATESLPVIIFIQSPRSSAL